MMLQNLPKRVAIYTRVSSEMQLDNYSLDAQENACQAFAQLRGWQVVKVYREEGASAKSTERPLFQQMMQGAELGQFDVVLVHKLDRFSRKLKDMISIIDYFDEIGIALVSATEQFDLSTPQGKMMVNVMGSVNQWYVDNLAQEISKGKRQRARSGDWNGTLSYGYTTPSRLKDELSQVSDDLRKGNITREQFQEMAESIEDNLDKYPDAHETQAIPHYRDSFGVVLAFEQYATGEYSASQIADMLNELGYSRISRDGTGLFAKDMVEKLLKNKFYLGLTSYGAKVKGMKRKWMQGNHDALISHELFNRCQNIKAMLKKGSNKNAHNRKRPYPLTPMMMCIEQGIRWRGHFQDGYRRYLRKRNNGIKGTHVKADAIENELIEAIASIEFPNDWKTQVIQNLRGNVRTKPKPQASKKQFERLKKLFILGHISEDEYMAEYRKIQGVLNQDAPMPINIDEIEIVGEIMSNIKALWEAATLDERDKLAKILFHKIYMRENKIAVVEPTAILSEMIRAAERTGIESATRILFVDFGASIKDARLLLA